MSFLEPKHIGPSQPAINRHFVEEDKPEAARGSYIHPELYGAPKEMDVLYAHPSDAKAQ